MAQLLHKKIQEARLQYKAIERRQLAINADGKLVKREPSNWDERILRGYLVMWGVRNMHGEKFIKGAFAKSIKEHGPNSNSPFQLKLNAFHNPEKQLARFNVLEEDDIGLYFETFPFDEVRHADDVLVQLRSGTLNNLSIEFLPIWEPGKVQWDDDDDSLVFIEARLFGAGVVGTPSDLQTFSLRSAQDLEDLQNDVEDFIDKVPRRLQYEARTIMARLKALSDNVEPPEKKVKALNTAEPLAEQVSARSIADLLIENLKKL